MLDKEKINEMAGDMQYGCVKHDLWPSDAKEIAKALIILGYQKIDKDKEVVLSREEYENLKLDIQEAHNKGVRVGFDLTKYKENQLSQTRKETTEKDFNAIIQALEERKDRVKAFYGVKESVGIDIAIRTVNELAKQFGVEIKEQ